MPPSSNKREAIGQKIWEKKTSYVVRIIWDFCKLSFSKICYQNKFGDIFYPKTVFVMISYVLYCNVTVL